jgi:hypothetical protein
MCLDGPHVRTPDPHTPVLPQGSALIPNVTPRPPRGWACYPWQLSRNSRLAPQINTSLFCALCPHSCAPENNFPVGHPSSDRSRPSTLNLEFFSDELPERKVYLVDMSILSIILSPEPDVTCTIINLWHKCNHAIQLSPVKALLKPKETRDKTFSTQTSLHCTMLY